MPDWKDLAIALAEALADARQQTPMIGHAREAALLRYESTVREIVSRYEIGAVSSGVSSRDEWRHGELWRKLEAARSLPDEQRAGPLEQVAISFLSTGPHGTGDPPRE